MAKGILRVTHKTAEDLMASLSSGNELWDGNRRFWVFRGHASHKYLLTPTALRQEPQAVLGYSYKPINGVQNTNNDQQKAEFQRIHEFYWAIDSRGLNVPGDDNHFRTPAGWEKLEKRIAKYGWPVDELLPLLALAQHYGVPTRLLDWSEKPLTAAYFAAVGAAENKRSKYISIWALNLDWVIHTGFPGKNKELSVYVVTAPRVSNPNLHAQGGVFTTEHLTAKDLKDSTKVIPVDKFIKRKCKQLDEEGTVMVEFRLPYQESGKLLRLLSQEEISAATLFPGYQGVANSSKEKELWDHTQRTMYWT